MFGKIHPRIKEIGDSLTVDNILNDKTHMKEESKRYGGIVIPQQPNRQDYTTAVRRSLYIGSIKSNNRILFEQTIFANRLNMGIEQLELCIENKAVSLTGKEYKYLKKKIEKILKQEEKIKKEDNRNLLNEKTYSGSLPPPPPPPPDRYF